MTNIISLRLIQWKELVTASEYCDLANKYLIAVIHVSADMDYIYFIVTLFVYSAKCLPNKTCNRIKIGNYWYEKELLWTDIGRPYNLNIHKGSNTLFFSYTVPEMYSDVDFQLAYYNLFSKEYQSIVGIRGGCAVAIDQSNDDIYLGGSDGIYKYNMVTKLADFYKQEGVNIWSLYHKKNLFYVSYPDQKLYIEIDGKFAKVKEFEQTEIDHIHISNEQAIYFANKTGLFKYNNIVSSIEIVNDLITVRQIVEDNNGDIYLCTNIGLFLDKKAKGFVNVLEMKNLHGLTFDRDNNFVLSDEKSVMKLIESRYGCMMSDEHW